MPNELKEILAILERPTPPKEVYFLPRGVRAKGNSKTEGVAKAIPYIESIYVENTLDEAAGKFGWQSDLKGNGGVLCAGIGIKDPSTKEWLWRWDVGLEKAQDKHGSKSEVTGAIKRAARQWGIGRDLKDYPKPTVPCKIWIDKAGKVRWSSWSVSPRAAVMESGGSKNGEQGTEEAAAANAKAAGQQAAAKADTRGTDEITTAMARKMVWDFAVGECDYTETGANKWIADQEKEIERTVEGYRKMYGMLKIIKAGNEPPQEGTA